MLLQLTARVSGLVGEPTNETEKGIRLDQLKKRRVPPSQLHALLGGDFFSTLNFE
jgi:hypothetical protein